jgi:hypothetical protein
MTPRHLRPVRRGEVANHPHNDTDDRPEIQVGPDLHSVVDEAESPCAA